MANIFSNPSYQSKKGYNGFDMSNLLKFSSTVGELLPVYYDILQPDDKVSMSTELRTRTMELNSAAMCKIKEHIDWFFVPLNQIYSIFGDWYFSIQDFKSSLFDMSQFPTTGVSTLPFLTSARAKSFFNSLKGNPDPVFNDISNTTLNGTQFRLAEMLGYPVSQYSKYEDAVFAPLCPILFCAYQKIYSDYFRLSDREPNNPSTYNLDRYYAVPDFEIDTDNFDMFTLRYRPWKKDFATNIFTSPLYNQDTSLNRFPDAYGSGFDKPNDWYSNSTAVIRDPNLSVASDANSTQIASAIPTPAVNPTFVTTAQIRKMFAVEKLLEITRRAGKHVDDQTLAHFGIKPPMGISGECKYIGSSVNDINIGDVIATASGNGVSLGEVGGKGYGYGKGDTIKFSAPCHGILMAIYSAVPEADYYSLGCDKLNLLMNRADWFTPEFDDLGMQPLFQFQLRSFSSGYSTVSRLGWQYRYSELKTKMNRIVGSLNYGRSLKYWTTGRRVSSNVLYTFLVNPTFLNTIMVRSYTFLADGDESNYFAADPLIHELYFDVKKSSRMSTYGLPSL